MEPAGELRPELSLRLLGGLSLTIDGEPVDFAAPMHRALLAILGINANTIVSTEHLIDELWGRGAPDGARATLQSYVSVIRKRCREMGRDGLIETIQPGYVLHLDPEESDVSQFRSHVAAARHVDVSPDSDGYSSLEAALALVDGRVLEDLAHLDTVRMFANNIEDTYRWAIEQRVEADLARGEASAVVPSLRRTVEAFPLEERMWSLLMRALYHAGRQAEALRAYQELREVLARELGVEPSEEVREVETAILTGTLPSTPASWGTPRRVSSPPNPTTPLFGRVADLNDLEAALSTHRLVTVTGPGGCGKTRLAVEAAGTLAARYDQVVWVELNTVEDPAGVEDAVAASLGLIRRREEGVLDMVADALQDKNTLMVVDNCEHLVDHAALVIQHVVSTCPELTVLATSRERLLIAGEQTVAVRPLASASPLELTRSRFEKPSDAAAMFIDRAGMEPPDEPELAVVEAISAQLDGIPLAIELAAPLVATMTLDEIADRLLDRFRLLGESHRSARPQHRTLRAVVEWSHELLDPEERRAFAALSLFRGQFSVEAAVDVANAVGVDARAVMPRLVRKSVVLLDGAGATSRYRMLESLRVFAHEQLSADRELERAVEAAFVEHYAELARRWGYRQQMAKVTGWLSELGPDISNLQTAVSLAQASDVDRALVFIEVFQWYYSYLGPMGETRQWLRRLVRTHELTPEQYTVVQTARAALANFSGDYGATAELAEDALASARELDDKKRLNAALIIRGTTATFEGKFERAASCFVEGAKLSEELGDLGGIAASMLFWGVAHRRMGNFEEARTHLDLAFDAFSRLDDDRGVAMVIGNLGRLAHQEGDYERAKDLTRRGMRLATDSLDLLVTAQTALFCGHLALDRGDLEQSLADLEVALRHSVLLGNDTLSSAALEWMVLVGGGQPSDVAVIDAFTEVQRNAPRTASPRPEWDAAVTGARESLDAADYRALVERGRRMSMDDASEYARSSALAALPGPGISRGSSGQR
ncbi:MAG: BTAD domain-containing putative transcriptional regulator [Acidimicrobiales bacterium]